jgi:pimeloyl-ACP methyl ester carboxylesterase
MTTRLLTDIDEQAERWAQLQDDAPIRRATVLRQLWAAMRFRAPPRLETRVLVLAGARDPFTDPACPRRVASHFGATLAVHPEAGHDLSIDCPEWTAAQIADWNDHAH